MKLYPAIDLRNGQVVRLTQGDYDKMTVYGTDPCAQARQFVAAGAKYLHVVDLDGAPENVCRHAGRRGRRSLQGAPRTFRGPRPNGISLFRFAL